MSLILDALRRAETQRQTQVQPVYSLPSGQRARDAGGALPAPPAMLAALAMAVLVIAVLITWLAASRPGAGAAPLVVSPLATPPSRSVAAPREVSAPRARPSGSRAIANLAATARADGVVRTRPTPTIAPATSTPPGSVQIVSAPTTAPTTTTGDAPFAPGTVVVRDLLAEEGISAGGSSITVATTAPPPQNAPTPTAPAPAPAPRDDAAIAGLAAAPTEFTLNMLSTSPDPANSYVYVNMRRYQIGDQTAEGAIIDDISNAGAVIRYRGQRYLLKSR